MIFKLLDKFKILRCIENVIKFANYKHCAHRIDSLTVYFYFIYLK